jgi:hypothetical protein
MLAMNRITSCKRTNVNFDYPIEFNLKEYVQRGKTGLAYSDSPVEFEGVFTGFAAEIVMETAIAENQTLSFYPSENDDKLLVKASITLNYDFETWLLGLANNVEVIKPESLRLLLIERLQAAVKLYGGV